MPARLCRRAYVRSVEESKALTANPMPKVIISASGMATGGRVLHHLKHYAPECEKHYSLCRLSGRRNARRRDDLRR